MFHRHRQSLVFIAKGAAGSTTGVVIVAAVQLAPGTLVWVGDKKLEREG